MKKGKKSITILRSLWGRIQSHLLSSSKLIKFLLLLVVWIVNSSIKYGGKPPEEIKSDFFSKLVDELLIKALEAILF